MFERNDISIERGLFAGKGQAKPTADYIPRLSTDSPAEIEDPLETNLPKTHSEAKAIPGSVGLGGLIQRRVEVGQDVEHNRDMAGFVEPEAQHDYARSDDSAHAEREARPRLVRESAELLAKASEQADRGMLYETLRLGLPVPRPEASEIKPTIPALRAEEESTEAATVETARPDVEPAPTPAYASDVPEKRPKRRKMTMRLEPEEWARLKAYADETDRTYQDILSNATNSYLDEVAGETTSPPVAAIRPADLPTPKSQAVKSPYDWFRTNRMR